MREASVLALLAMRAEIELRAPGTHQTVLHLAAIRGHPDITQACEGCMINSLTVWLDTAGRWEVG